MIDRIKQVMEYSQMNPASFAEQIGINRSNLTHLFSGRNQPSLELAKKILHAFPEIKTEWLVMGVGGMMRSEEEKELNIKIQNEKNLYKEKTEPDLFAAEATQKNRVLDSLPEQAIAQEKKIDDRIFDSKRDMEKRETKVEIVPPIEKEVLPSHPPASPTVSKIIFFYSDNSFEIFHPNK